MPCISRPIEGARNAGPALRAELYLQHSVFIFTRFNSVDVYQT